MEESMLEIIKNTELEYQCYECGHIEKTLFELSQHIKKEHTDDAVVIQPTPHIFILRKFLRVYEASTNTNSKRILLEEIPAVMP